MSELSYIAFVRPTQNGFGIRIPDFPDVAEVEAERIDDAKKPLVESVAARIEAIIRAGEVLPRPRTMIHFQMDDIQFPELETGTAMMPIPFVLPSAAA